MIFKWLFVILIIGAIVYTFRGSAGPIFAQLKKEAPSVIFGICIMSVIYEMLEGMITFILARQYNAKFKYRWGAGNAFFCSFYRVATLGSGSGVAAILYLSGHGIEYSEGFGLYMLQYAFHKISIALFSLIFFLLGWKYMLANFGAYLWLLAAGYAFTVFVTIFLILFCCSKRFHHLLFLILQFFNKKGKLDGVKAELAYQCAELEEASRYLLKKKAMVAGVIVLNIVKLCFWYGIPYLLLAGNGGPDIIETMAVTSLSVMLAAVIPTPAGIGSTELVFIMLFEGLVGTGLAGSALLLYRFATFVFPFLVGMVYVVIRHIRQRRRGEQDRISV